MHQSWKAKNESIFFKTIVEKDEIIILCLSPHLIQDEVIHCGLFYELFDQHDV
jgi:hypothetical protein